MTTTKKSNLPYRVFCLIKDKGAGLLWKRSEPPLPPPSLEVAIETATRIADEWEDLGFYIDSIPDYRPGAQFAMFATRADYGIKSARDELKIEHRFKKESGNERLRSSNKGN